MLKLSQLIVKYRSALLLFLFLPIFSVFIGDQFKIGMVPENPHLKFNVSFSVPSRTAREIEKLVTKPAEKVFNGLPGLIGIESKTVNEKSTIALIFVEKSKSNVVYLNIQEKMDRIKLMLPGDVESYSVERSVIPRPSDVKLYFSSEQSVGNLTETLRPLALGITKTEPALFSSNGIKIKLDPVRLFKNKLSISQVVLALKSLGISTSLGRKNGIMFETGRNFNSIDDVRGALIGARGDRPIKLSDVADISIKEQKAVTELSIWIDADKISTYELNKKINNTFAVNETKYPLWEQILEQAIQPTLLILLCFVLNFWVIRFIQLPSTSLLYLAGMGGLVIVHFLFWKGLISPPLTVLDLHALAFTLIVGSMFLSVLYVRIRSFFVGQKAFNRVEKTLEQAKLFTLAELVPTFVVLIIAMWVASLPVLNSAVNLPSREILSSVFYFGFPILLFITIFVMLSTPGEFLKKNINLPKANHLKWNLSGNRAQWAVWTLTVFILAYGFVFVNFDIGVSSNTVPDDYSGKMLTNYRGYGERLVYQSSNNFDIGDSYEYLERNETEESKVYQFSSSGLRFLGELDIIGFSDSLKSLQAFQKIGDLGGPLNPISVSLSPEYFSADEVPNLLFASTTADVLSKPLRVLTEVKNTFLETKILKDNMTQGHRVIRSRGASLGNFLTDISNKFKATPWTEYLQSQFQRYKQLHLLSLVFLFLVFAIYLNSFVRSGLILVFVLSTAGFISVLQYFLPGVVHSDSLWLMNVGSFMALFQILVLARVIDIDRTRGFDRDVCVQEVREKLAPGVYLCSWSFVIALFVAGLTEYIPGLPTLGFWHEALFNSVLTGTILIFSTHVLFPLFYLNSEEAINKIAFKIYKKNPFRNS